MGACQVYLRHLSPNSTERGGEQEEWSLWNSVSFHPAKSCSAKARTEAGEGQQEAGRATGVVLVRSVPSRESIAQLLSTLSLGCLAQDLMQGGGL